MGKTPPEIPSDIRYAITSLASGDRDSHGDVHTRFTALSLGGLPWADAAWRELVPLLAHSDNRVRAIAGQALCRLSPSVSPGLVIGDLDKLVAATRDERFVTARHILSSLWMVGLKDDVRQPLARALVARARATAAEKNAALVRHDVVACLRTLYGETQDPAIRTVAVGLVEAETDTRTAAKMTKLWRSA